MSTPRMEIEVIPVVRRRITSRSWRYLGLSPFGQRGADSGNGGPVRSLADGERQEMAGRTCVTQASVSAVEKKILYSENT